MVKPEPIIITVDEHGHLTTDWWTPETGDLICKLCQDCQGWRSGKKPLDCVAGSEWCG